MKNSDVEFKTWMLNKKHEFWRRYNAIQEDTETSWKKKLSNSFCIFCLYSIMLFKATFIQESILLEWKWNSKHWLPVLVSQQLHDRIQVEKSSEGAVALFRLFFLDSELLFKGGAPPSPRLLFICAGQQYSFQASSSLLHQINNEAINSFQDIFRIATNSCHLRHCPWSGMVGAVGKISAFRPWGPLFNPYFAEIWIFVWPSFSPKQTQLSILPG